MEFNKLDIGKIIIVTLKRKISTIFQKDMTVFCEILSVEGDFKLTTPVRNTQQTFGKYYLEYLKSLQQL